MAAFALCAALLGAGCASEPLEDEPSEAVAAAPAPAEPRESIPPAPPAPATVAPVAEPRIPATPEPQNGRFVGYTAAKWMQDFGVTHGRCDPAAAGGALESAMQPPGVAQLLGLSARAKVGVSLTASDRACLGHTLELARVGQTVSWKAPASGTVLAVTPTRHFVRERDPCREFRMTLRVAGTSRSATASACRVAGGRWESVD